MSKNYIYGFLAVISMLFTTCQKETPEPPDFSNKITITTGEATEVSYRSAKLTGTLDETYGQEITDYGHCWDSISKPTIEDDKTSFGSIKTAKNFSSKIDDIVPGQKYYTRVYFIIGETIVYGSQQSFTTLKLDKPVVETIEAINVGITSATLSGKVVDAMGDSITARGFCYGPGPDPAIESDSVAIDTLQTTGNFSITINSLQPGKTYYARAYATNNTGIGYGDEITLTTGIDLPSIATTEVTGISDSTAVCGGENIDAGGGTISQKGICWGTEADVTLENATGFSEEGTGAEAFTTSIEGLDYAKTYYVRAYIKNETGTGYGEIKSFNTKKALPKVSPVQITLRTATGAKTAGEVINDGGAEVTSRGVCWNTTGNPTTTDNKTTDGTGTGSFTSNLTKLQENTTYYVRAYAINEIGTEYGDEINFTTKDGIPALTTADATEITATTAVSGGTITDDGGASITARGVCWSTNENPTIEDNKTIDGTGTGSFNSNIKELQENTTYYVRAYAINKTGTVYGNQQTFTTPIYNPNTVPDAPTVGTATAGDAQASVPFTAPADDGGSTITTYTATSSPGNITGTISQAGSGTITVTGLTNGTAYTFTVTATNSVGTSAASAASNSVTPTSLSIGDYHQGGVVFYLDGSGGGLVCAVSDQSSGAEWGCDETPISGADGTAIGTGAQNTNDIEAGCTTAGIAADICANLSLKGYNDWFLPSKEELNLMYQNKATIDATAGANGGSGFASAFYWSSTEIHYNTAWEQTFGSGHQASAYKYDARRVRAVRAF